MAEDLSDDNIVKALAHPARREILRIFDEGIASPKEIAARVKLPLPNVSYHVKILRELGLIELEPRRRDAAPSSITTSHVSADR